MPGSEPDGTLVDLRCSVAAIQGGSVLLVHRPRIGDWVLPGGAPRPGESLAACARREVREETGLAISPGRCAFVLEVGGNEEGRRVDIVFLGELEGAAEPLVGEADCHPEWVAFERLSRLRLHPPLAGYLPGLARSGAATAPYLGNMWRPEESAQWE
jgi:8-oxo-dGTP pyrophosphatase MutT (NUDIX family)